LSRIVSKELWVVEIDFVDFVVLYVITNFGVGAGLMFFQTVYEVSMGLTSIERSINAVYRKTALLLTYGC